MLRLLYPEKSTLEQFDRRLLGPESNFLAKRKSWFAGNRIPLVYPEV
jgi:hypothetical protein